MQEKINIEVSGEFNHLQITKTNSDNQKFRYVVSPTDDLTGQPIAVIEAVNKYHTEDIITNYKKTLKLNEPAPLSNSEIVEKTEATIREIRNEIYANGDAGQTASYAQKLEQARAYKAADYPASASEYAYIVEGAKDQPFTKHELADAIIARANAYVLLDAKIEAARTIVKVKVAAAADDEKQAAADLVVSDLQAVIAAIMAA